MEHIYFVNAHPDDVLSSLATARKFQATGRFILHVVDLTHGERGLTGIATEEECVRLRDAEERNVCSHLGVTPVWLQEHDGAAFVTDASCRQLADLYAAAPPRAIFTHWPLDRHLDHMMCASVALNALRLCSGHRRGVMKQGWPEILFYHIRNSMADCPNAFVPLSEAEMEEKCALIRLYECQHGDRMAEDERDRNRFYGQRIREPYAEAFTRLQPLTVGSPSVLEALAARS